MHLFPAPLENNSGSLHSRVSIKGGSPPPPQLTLPSAVHVERAMPPPPPKLEIASLSPPLPQPKSWKKPCKDLLHKTCEHYTSHGVNPLSLTAPLTRRKYTKHDETCRAAYRGKIIKGCPSSPRKNSKGLSLPVGTYMYTSSPMATCSYSKINVKLKILSLNDEIYNYTMYSMYIVRDSPKIQSLLKSWIGEN